VDAGWVTEVEQHALSLTMRTAGLGWCEYRCTERRSMVQMSARSSVIAWLGVWAAWLKAQPAAASQLWELHSACKVWSNNGWQNLTRNKR
jgi:hypothetical protein